jgi:hypothetical protein
MCLHREIFLKSSQEPPDQRAEIYMKAFRHSAKSSLLKSWTPGVDWGHNRGNLFYMCLHRKIFLKSSSQESLDKKS